MKSPFSDHVNSMGPAVWVGDSPPNVPDGQDFFWVQCLTSLLPPATSLLMAMQFVLFLKEPNMNETFTDGPVKRNGHHINRLVRSRNEPLSEEICKTNR